MKCLKPATTYTKQSGLDSRREWRFCCCFGVLGVFNVSSYTRAFFLFVFFYVYWRFQSDCVEMCKLT